MKKAIVCTRYPLRSIVTAFCIAGGLLYLRLSLKAELAGSERSDAATESALAAQISAISGCKDEDLEVLRAKIGHIRLQMGDDVTWTRMESKLGAQWQRQGASWTEESGFSLRTEILERRHPDIDDWLEIVRSVKAWEAVPGVSVVAFEMRTSGGRDHRTLDLARVTLSVRSRTPLLRP